MISCQQAHEQYLKTLDDWEEAEKKFTAAIREYVVSQPVSNSGQLPASKPRPLNEQKKLQELARCEKLARKRLCKAFQEYYGWKLNL
jgi:hypothetical protein